MFGVPKKYCLVRLINNEISGYGTRKIQIFTPAATDTGAFRQYKNLSDRVVIHDQGCTQSPQLLAQ
jgi:hypothetical protein